MFHFIFVTFLLLALVLSTPASAEVTATDMEARVKESLEKDKSYETTAVAAFWGDAAFMRSCVPKDAPLPEPFIIYFEVLPTGGLGETLFDPLTEVGKCIRKGVESRSFPKPMSNYVVKIEMKFTP